MKKLIMTLCVIFTIFLPYTGSAEHKMAKVWREMSERERQAYALGIREGFAVMCLMTTDGKEEYIDCINEFCAPEDMPKSLFDIFDKAYTERKFNNIPPEVLLGIWTTRKGRNIDNDLRMAEEAAKNAKLK